MALVGMVATARLWLLDIAMDVAGSFCKPMKAWNRLIFAIAFGIKVTLIPPAIDTPIAWRYPFN